MMAAAASRLWDDAVHNANIGLAPANRAERRRQARAGGKPSRGTRKDKRIKGNKKGGKK